MTTTTRKRDNYLDNLKVALTLLVIFHHAAQAYGPGGEWIVKRTFHDEYCPWLGNLFSVNASFFMGLFFLISGYFIPRSYDHNGCGTFLWKKFLRLGVPLLVFILIPFSLLSHSIQLGHGWYLEHLLFYSLVYALWVKLTRCKINQCDKRPSLWVFGLIAIVLIAITWPVRMASPQDHWMDLMGFLRCEPCHLPQYASMFVLGIVARRRGWFAVMRCSTGYTLLGVGVVLSLIHLIEPALGLPFYLWDYWGAYEPLMAVTLCFGLVILFRQRFNGTSRIMQFLVANAYGAYIFHFLILLLVQYYLDPLMHIGVLPKVLLLTAITAVLTFAQTALLRLIPGMKKIL